MGIRSPDSSRRSTSGDLTETVDGETLDTRGEEAVPVAGPNAGRGRNYNQVVSDWTSTHPRAAAQARRQTASWGELEVAQRENETAAVRCVGLSLETRSRSAWTG